MQHQQPKAFAKASRVAERDRQIIALFNGGQKPADIAAVYGISAITVRGVLSEARRAGGDVKATYQKDTEDFTFKTRIDRTALERLQAEADRRGVSIQRLCMTLLRLIAADDMFAAIIEDEGADFSAQGEGADQ